MSEASFRSSAGATSAAAVSRTTKAACKTGSIGVSRCRVVTAAIMIGLLLSLSLSLTALTDWFGLGRVAVLGGGPRGRNGSAACVRGCHRGDVRFPAINLLQ